MPLRLEVPLAARIWRQVFASTLAASFFSFVLILGGCGGRGSPALTPSAPMSNLHFPQSQGIANGSIASEAATGAAELCVQPNRPSRPARAASCGLSGTIGYLPPPSYVPPSGPTCDVSDTKTLATCINAVRSSVASRVRFTAMVNCSGSNACFIDLSNVHGPVTFFGATSTNAGFLRTDSYSYPIFQLYNASDVTIANLTFDEGPEDPTCSVNELNYPCQSTISVSHSSNVTLQALKVLHSKNHAIEVSATQGLTIRDSHIQDAGAFGIWSGFNESLISTNVSITNNLIEDVKSNGIFLSFTQNTSITRNTLRHNHRVALFNVCNGLCPGGQLLFLDNNFLLIESNDIRDGQIDLNNATGQTSGIEIDAPNQNVRIANNSVTDNLGAGIGANPGSTGTNFQITGNRIYNNGGYFGFQLNISGIDGTGIQEFDNCFTP